MDAVVESRGASEGSGVHRAKGIIGLEPVVDGGHVRKKWRLPGNHVGFSERARRV